MKRLQVLIADDHQLVRAGFRSLLGATEGIDVVGEAADGMEALRQIKALRPDVVLLDISMEGLNGIEAMERIARKFRHVRVIMVSMHMNPSYVLRAFRAGASGYLVKDAIPAELELAIRAVARGETYISPSVSEHVIRGFVRQYSQKGRLEDNPEEAEKLTLRQREILQMIAEGRSSKQIAQTLSLSLKTVDSHRTELMKRLNLHSVAGLVRYAIRAGLISAE